MLVNPNLIITSALNLIMTTILNLIITANLNLISKTTLTLYSLYSLLQKTTARYLVIQSCTENTKKI